MQVTHSDREVLAIASDTGVEQQKVIRKSLDETKKKVAEGKSLKLFQCFDVKMLFLRSESGFLYDNSHTHHLTIFAGRHFSGTS